MPTPQLPPDAPLVVRAADALTFTTTPTDRMRFLLEGDADLPDIYDEQLMPGDGPPLHRHPWATWDVIIEGRVRFRIGEQTIDAGPGDLVLSPPNVPHAFMGIGDRGSRIIGINLHGGFHRMYADLAAAFAGPGEPDFGAMAEAAQRHGAEILGPPLVVLDQGGQ